MGERIIKIIFFLFLLFLLIPFGILSQSRAAIVECRGNLCDWDDLSRSFGNLISTLVALSYWIAFLICVVGAFLIMFSGPSQNLYQRGKNMIITALIAYVLILTSGIIFQFILEFFSPKLKTYLSEKNLANLFFINISFSQGGAGGGSSGAGGGSSDAGGGSSGGSLSASSPFSYLNFLTEKVGTSLRCGSSATTMENKLLSCIIEISNSLTKLALFVLTLSIIISGGILILAPVLGFEKINQAKLILIWSIIGLIIILTANLIVNQVKRIFVI